VTINASTNELVQLGNAFNQISGIWVPVTVNGDGTTTLNVKDQGSVFSDTYTVTDTGLSTLWLGPIVNYTGLQTLNLWPGPGGSVNDFHNPGLFQLN
jgi:hypothetical protein